MDNSLQRYTIGQPAQTTEITETLSASFIEFLQTMPQTAATYKASLRRLFRYFNENEITRPTRADIIKYRAMLMEQYSPSSVSLHMTAARLFFRWTQQEGIYPNIADNIKGAKASKNFKKDYLTSSQVKEILATAQGDTITQKRDFAILAIMVTTGLRCVEISRASVEDLRPIGDDQGLYIQGKGRDAKDERVKIAPQVKAALDRYFAARGNNTGDAPLFTNDSIHKHGGRLTTRSISRIVKSHMIAAGYNSSRLTAHSLRHTCATLNLLKGGTIEETQQLLRHSNINTTLIYDHALEREKNNSEARIAAAIF